MEVLGVIDGHSVSGSDSMMVAKMMFLDRYCDVKQGSKTQGGWDLKRSLKQELLSEWKANIIRYDLYVTTITVVPGRLIQPRI